MRTVLLASELGQVSVAVFQDTNMFIQRLPHHARSMVLRVATPTSRLSFALAIVPTMNAREWTGICNSSEDTGMGVTDFAHIRGSESMMDAVHATGVGSVCAGLGLDAGSGHKFRSPAVCSVGDTRQSFSEK